MTDCVYISGQISGLTIAEAKTKFDAAEEYLLDAGYYVINPLKLIPPDSNMSWEACMRFDLIVMLSQCNAIYMLRNYSHSRGAKLELAIAKKLNYRVMYEDVSNNHN